MAGCSGSGTRGDAAHISSFPDQRQSVCLIVVCVLAARALTVARGEFACDGDPDVSLPSEMFFVALCLTSPCISARYLAFNRQSTGGCKWRHFALRSFSDTGEFSPKVISLSLPPGALLFVLL